LIARKRQKFGYLHASYGLGALVCPLAATAFASAGIRFSFFYSISIGLAFINVLTLLYAFRFSYRIADENLSAPPAQIAAAEEIEMERVRSREEEGEIKTTTSVVEGPAMTRGKERGLLVQTLRNRLMWTFAMFILV